MLLLVLLWAAAYFGDRPVEHAADWLRPTRPVVLYFASEDAMGVAAEIRWLTEEQSSLAGRVKALVEGPTRPGLYPSLPKSTVVLDAIRQNDLVVVNFDRHMIEDHGGGSAGEIITVYSIVNTLTEVEGVEQVQILVEGRRVETIAGHLDVSRPIARDESIIVTQ